MDHSTERWVPVPERPEYEVSDCGRVRRIWILSPGCAGSSGVYKAIRLGTKGNHVYKSIHRLILESFVGPPPTEGMVAAHKDGDPSNNCLSNLEWVTQSENLSHRKRHDSNYKMTWTTVREMRRLYATGWLQKDLAERFNVNPSYVSRIVNHYVWVEDADHEDGS